MGKPHWQIMDERIAPVLEWARGFIGKPFEELQTAGYAKGWFPRASMLDGKYIWVGGFHLRRINVSVKNGIVKSINGLG